MKKTEEEIAKEEARIKQKESKKQEKLSTDTKFSHRYVFVVTSLPSTISAQAILSIYRLRWQVELVFKRYKSLLDLGSIPVQKTESCEAWLQGKMLIAILIEKFLGNVDFPPLGTQQTNRSIWRETKFVYRLILALLLSAVELPVGQDFLPISLALSVEKRSVPRLQLPSFVLS